MFLNFWRGFKNRNLVAPKFLSEVILTPGNLFCVDGEDGPFYRIQADETWRALGNNNLIGR